MAPPGPTVRAALCRVIQAPAVVSPVLVIWQGARSAVNGRHPPTFDETYGAEGNAEGGAQEGGAPDGDETGSGAGGNNGSGSRGRAALQTAATRPGPAPAPVVA